MAKVQLRSFVGKQGRLIFCLCLSCVLLTACVSNVLTGVSMIYDRHTIYKKIDDYRLAARISRALYHDQVLRQSDCAIDIAVFNGDVLLAGHVPTEELRDEIKARVKPVSGYRRLFNQLAVVSTDEPQVNALQDDLITGAIRSEIIADSSIDPHEFKVVTCDQIVYLMGDVMPEQAARVVRIARACSGVKRVVTLFKYYHLSDKN